MLVTGRVRFGGHWRINVSARGCGHWCDGALAHRHTDKVAWAWGRALAHWGQTCGRRVTHMGVRRCVWRGARGGGGCALACWCVLMAAWTALGTWALGACTGVGTWGVYRLALAHGRRMHVGALASGV